MRRKRKKMNRRVAKDKRFKSVPKAYLSGTKGAKRTQRGRDITRMQKIYKQGKGFRKLYLKEYLDDRLDFKQNKERYPKSPC